MTDDGHEQSALDWGSASVDDGRLTVPVIGDVPTGWTKRVQRVVERLERPGGRWGAVKVTKQQLRVEAVSPGAEHDLHHFLESVVLQANADLRDESGGGPEAERSERDQQMTEAFRSLAADRPDDDD
jgi:hypothetical protein